LCHFGDLNKRKCLHQQVKMDVLIKTGEKKVSTVKQVFQDEMTGTSVFRQQAIHNGESLYFVAVRDKSRTMKGLRFELSEEESKHLFNDLVKYIVNHEPMFVELEDWITGRLMEAKDDQLQPSFIKSMFHRVQAS